MRVLIVENKPTLDIESTGRLRALDESITLDVTDSVQRAAELLERNDAYDVLVVDFELKNSSGINASESLRLLSPDTATIVTTEEDTADLAKRLTRLGVQDYIPKAELSPERLMRAVHLAYERQRREVQLRNEVLKDPLTQSLNRRGLVVALGKSLDMAAEFGTFSMLCSIDIDRFKWINDSLGHPSGDAILLEACRRMQSSVRGSDHVGRPGGDEFWLILNGISPIGDVSAIVEKVFNCFTPPFDIGHRKVNVDVSIGVAIAPTHADSIDGWIDCADKALYEAKRGGRNAYRVYSAGRRQILVE